MVPKGGNEPSPSLHQSLEDLFAAERRVRVLHDQVAAFKPAELLPVLSRHIAEANALEDEGESELRLVRLGYLVSEIEGPKSVDLLIDILGSEPPEARRVAGECLLEVAFERFKEVALGVERALDRLPEGSPALSELPFVLVEVAEPGVTKLLGKFLGHKDPEAVAAAIEACADLGDPSMLPLLARLEGDRRMVSSEGEDGEEGMVTLGELAQEARDILLDQGDGPEFVGVARGGMPPSGSSGSRTH